MKNWAHLTEASIWVIDRILINKNCILLISRLPRPSFWATFDLKMAKFRFFSYYSSMTIPRKVILDMHTHISPSYNNWSLTLTSKVTWGHWEVIRGQKGQYIYFFVNYLLDQSFTLHTHIISWNNVSIKKWPQRSFEVILDQRSHKSIILNLCILLLNYSTQEDDF